MVPEARSKFGAPVFEPEIFRKQMHCIGESTCNIVGTFRPPGNCAPRRYVSMVSKSSDFYLCPLILNSHSISACICLRLKFNNQQNAQHTAAVY